MDKITSLSNPRVRFWADLANKKTRDASGVFLVDEDHLLEEASKRGLLRTLLVKEGVEPVYPAKETIEVSESVLHKIRTTVSDGKRAGIVEKPVLSSPKNRVILLENIQDPGNMGTMIRIAYAFGFDAVLYSAGCADPFGPKVVRSTQGALFALYTEKADLIQAVHELEEKHVRVYGTALEGGKDLETFSYNGPVGLVFGNEGAGMSEALKKSCDDLIYIPQKRFESLNAAVSCGIAAYHFSRLWKD